MKDSVSTPTEVLGITALGHDDLLTLKGLWEIRAYRGELERRDGLIVNELVYAERKKNLIVTSGKGLILDRLFGLGGAAALSAVGVGTDSTAAAVGQTQLNPSVAGSVLIQAADGGAGATTRTNQTVTIQSTFGTGVANFAWQELGLFNGTTNGTSTMLNRVVVGPFTKTAAVSIVAVVQLTQS